MRHGPTRLATALIPVALIMGVSACSFPNEPVTQAAAEVSEPLSSGEILGVLHTINQGEIEQAELALQRSNDPAVQEAARLIIADHTTSNERIASVARSTGVELEESPLSRGYALQMGEIRDELAEVPNDEFAETFLQKQAEQHALALETAQSDLLPNAQDPQIRNLLMVAIPNLEQHLLAARENYESVAQRPGD